MDYGQRFRDSRDVGARLCRDKSWLRDGLLLLFGTPTRNGDITRFRYGLGSVGLSWSLRVKETRG